MLEGLLHHKKEIRNFICALSITEDRIDGALWETAKDNKVNILKTTNTSYTSNNWEEALLATDKVISLLETSLPQEDELTRVVFGLFPEWIADDKIKEIYLKKIKQITARLSLTALGFVEIPTAVAFQLHQNEGTQQTVILIGCESKHITVSLFKIGKLIGSVTLERSPDAAVDVEKALATFIDVEVLPSQLLLYGTTADLESIKNTLMNYPWQKRANFLHFPKIEILPDDFMIKSVAFASATEITPQTSEDLGGSQEVKETQFQEVPTTVVSTPIVTNDSAANIATHPVSKTEVSEITEDLGFIKDEDIAISREARTPIINRHQDLPITEKYAEENVVPVRPSFGERKKFSFPKISFSHFNLILKLPQFSKIWLLGGIILLVAIIGGSYYAANYYLPKATITILVSPKIFEKNEMITIDTKATAIDEVGKIIPGKELQTEITGNKQIPTTGKKTIGDKAKGEITIYNKTTNDKTFRKGTVFLAGKLQFTLDDDVTIKAASESIGSLTYGNSKANLTASDIGTASNVSPATEFLADGLPSASYSGRNDKSFAGGSSREVSVVSRDDQSSVREQVIADLEKQSQGKLQQQVGEGYKLLDNSIKSNITKETFSKEVGEESDNVSIDVTVTITGLSYNDNDIMTMVGKIIDQNLPPNYDYRKEDVGMSTTEAAPDKQGRRTFNIHIKVNLLPKIDTKDFAQNLVGKGNQQATEYLKSQSNVSGVKIDINAPWEFLKNKLPINPKNIQFKVEPLE